VSIPTATLEIIKVKSSASTNETLEKSATQNNTISLVFTAEERNTSQQHATIQSIKLFDESPWQYLNIDSGSLQDITHSNPKRAVASQSKKQKTHADLLRALIQQIASIPWFATSMRASLISCPGCFLKLSLRVSFTIMLIFYLRTGKDQTEPHIKSCGNATTKKERRRDSIALFQTGINTLSQKGDDCLAKNL